jgi:ketosteroid isomerase-like protein
MSRRSLLMVGVTLPVALGCHASTKPSASADVAQLLATDREWSSLATTSKNADTLIAYWTDDARVVGPGQPVVAGKAAIREMVTGMMQIPGFRISWTPDSAVISGSGDLGYTYGTNEFTEPDATGKLVTRHGRYLTVWRRDVDGRWRCVQDYSTPGPAASGRA